MTFYLKRGNTFNVTTKDQLDLHETLPAGSYTVEAFVPGSNPDLPLKVRPYSEGWKGNPMSEEIQVSGYVPDVKKRRGRRASNPLEGWENELNGAVAVDTEIDEDEAEETEKYVTLHFRPADLKKVDEQTGQFLYENEKKQRLILSKKIVSSYNWGAF